MLRQLRTERGLSVDDITGCVMFSDTKLSLLETGHLGTSPCDIRDLCIVFGIAAVAERGRLIGLEAEVTSISDYNPDVLPGLLQVPGYARSIFESVDLPLRPLAVEQRMEAGIGAWEQLSPHSLRHSAITFALDAGASLRDVQDYAGRRIPAPPAATITPATAWTATPPT